MSHIFQAAGTTAEPAASAAKAAERGPAPGVRSGGINKVPPAALVKEKPGRKPGSKVAKPSGGKKALQTASQRAAAKHRGAADDTSGGDSTSGSSSAATSTANLPFTLKVSAAQFLVAALPFVQKRCFSPVVGLCIVPRSCRSRPRFIGNSQHPGQNKWSTFCELCCDIISSRSNLAQVCVDAVQSFGTGQHTESPVSVTFQLPPPGATTSARRIATPCR